MSLLEKNSSCGIWSLSFLKAAQNSIRGGELFNSIQFPQYYTHHSFCWSPSVVSILTKALVTVETLFIDTLCGCLLYSSTLHEWHCVYQALQKCNPSYNHDSSRHGYLYNPITFFLPFVLHISSVILGCLTSKPWSRFWLLISILQSRTLWHVKSECWPINT